MANTPNPVSVYPDPGNGSTVESAARADPRRATATANENGSDSNAGAAPAAISNQPSS